MNRPLGIDYLFVADLVDMSVCGRERERGKEGRKKERKKERKKQRDV